MANRTHARLTNRRGAVAAHIPTRWFAKVDGCPECIYNVEAPRMVEPDEGDGGPGFYAHYDCRDCGAKWRTAWADEEADA